MSITTRDGQVSDLPAVLALNQLSQPAVNGLTLEQLTNLVGNSAFFRVIELNRRLAGFVLNFLPNANYPSENLRWFNQHYDDFLYLDRVAIADFAKRRGCGTTLYSEVERYCRQHHINNIALEVNLRPRNQASLDFHAAMGFQEVGRQETAAGSKTVSLMMKKINEQY